MPPPVNPRALKSVTSGAKSTRRAQQKKRTAVLAPPLSRPTVECHPLEFVLPANARVLFCGSFPPVRSRWAMDFFYPNRNNDMWRVLGLVFFNNATQFFMQPDERKANAATNAPAASERKTRAQPSKLVFNLKAINEFLIKYQVGLLDAAKRVVRHSGTSSDDNLSIVESVDFLRDVFPRVPQCEAVIATGTLALTTLQAQRNAAEGHDSFSNEQQVGQRQRKSSARKSPALPPIGGYVDWIVPPSADGSAAPPRVIRVYRGPSTSRAYPKPIAEKLLDVIKKSISNVRMALFLVNKPAYEGVLNERLIVAHRVQPLLATAWSAPASVLVTDQEGEFLTAIRGPNENTAAQDSDVTVTSLVWHPFKRILIIGWSSGQLTTWFMPAVQADGAVSEQVEEAGDAESLSEAHRGNVALLSLAARHAIVREAEEARQRHEREAVLVSTWAPSGQFLFTSSQAKPLVLWVLEQAKSAGSDVVAYTVMPLWTTNAVAPVFRALYVPPTAPPPQLQRPQEGGLVKMPGGDAAALAPAAVGSEDGDGGFAFLLADGMGQISTVTSEGKLAPCVLQEDKTLTMLYDVQRRIVVTLSEQYVIDVYRLTMELTAESIMRRKVTVPNTTAAADKSKVTMIWVDAGVIALACGDERVRFFDLNTESMTSVTFPSSGDHVFCVATEGTKGMLAMGSVEGTVAMFQSAHSKSPQGTHSTGAASPGRSRGNAPQRWQPVATHELGEPIQRIVLTPRGDMAVCSGSGHLAVLHETIRKRAWDGMAAATQISANMIVIESVTGCQCLLKSENKVRGLSISFPYIALWSGSQIDLYTINETTSECSRVNFVPEATSPAFAVHQEGLFYVKDNRIIYATFQLQQISQLTFTEAEGVPTLLDVMNTFLVAVSSRNVLRLARISPRDLRPLGPSRPLHLTPPSAPENKNAGEGSTAAPAMTVMTARINAQGRRVALLTSLNNGEVPDSRIWVYDADTDKVSFFDFAPRGELPEAIYWNTPEPSANSIGELEYLLLACETHRVRSGKTESGAGGRAGGVDSPPTYGSTSVEDSVHAQSHRNSEVAEAMPDMVNYADARAQMDHGGAGSSFVASNILEERDHHIVTLFATHGGIALHNSVSLKQYQICLAGLTIPDFLLASVKINGNPSNPEDYVIEQKRLRDFDGLKSDKDVVVREALMKFSYYSTIGNMDEAYRCIKTIKNPAAWQGLARMCVSNGRLDVAAVCLATMEDGVAARALQESKRDYPNNKKVQLATLACSLGMNDECIELLRAGKQDDLVTDVFLACGKFEQAQRHSERADRIHIRPVAYKYAQFMESLQNFDAAIMWYYNAKCAATDVPRIYYQNNRLLELRELLLPSKVGSHDGGKDGCRDGSPKREAPAAVGDPRATFAALFPYNRDLLLWWAQQSERRRNVQEALRFYTAGKDMYSVVRILCALNPPKLDSALEIVDAEVERVKLAFQQEQAISTVRDGTAMAAEPERVGAAFFVGQLFEGAKDAKRALQYYKYAGAYRSGVRVAMHEGLDSEVAALSLASEDEQLILRSAVYLEKRAAFERAVALYRKIDATQYALNACIKGGLFEALHEISAGLASASTDPEVFLGMANHFQSTGDYQKAVEMLVFAQHYEEALVMCQERNVTLTEDMAETMTGANNPLPADEKHALLLKVAKIAKDQGSWNLACKKYTQAGERLKAMKMLMRGGDVDKVIFFANHSRTPEIFTLAGNFLQSQNWGGDAAIYRSIVTFYTKAKAYNNLIAFYDACTLFQIDENRNYPEALRVTAECIRVVEKAIASKSDVSEAKLTELKQRAAIMGSFVKAQHLLNSMSGGESESTEDKTKGDEVITICADIIKRSRPGSPDHELIESALRVGDVFALMVKFYFEKLREPKNALRVLESMPKHGVEPQYFLEMSVIKEVCAAGGKPVSAVLKTQADTVVPVSIDGGDPAAS